MINPKTTKFFAIARYNNQPIRGDVLYYSTISIDAAAGGKLKLAISDPVCIGLANGPNEAARVAATIGQIPRDSPLSDKSSDDLDLKILSNKPRILSINANGENNGKGCYFAFALKRSILDWHFDLLNLAVTTEIDWGYESGGGGVMDRIDQVHLFKDDLTPVDIDMRYYKFDHPLNVREDCKIVVFGIREMIAGEQRKLNLHVTFGSAATARVPTIFDPDIRNDGTGFPPPP